MRRALRRALLAAAGLLPAAAWPQATVASYAERYAAQCAACHGAQGVSTLAQTPSLAGQPSFYAITQLFLFRDGRRDSGPMTAIAKTMSDDDLRGFADAIGKLPPAPPAATSPPDAQRLARGAAAAQRLHCLGCHGSQGEGARQVPRVAGQREDYLLLALRGFRAGTRAGYQPAMTEAMAGVAADELDDLAHFLAHLPVQPGARP
ncbi:c-type cytochrome [Pseudaquabacterium pictum]|uniref:c-type cytochrome n=1 Tax=Pseudaquabacterium pictum TaxID=2315236 RepID=UPI0010F48322|nr:c-type cytochrome [Rubrivivax pictus]